MWARIEDNNIVEYYDRKQSLLLNDVRYSSQIFTIWTDAQRKELRYSTCSNFRITS